VGWVLRRGWPGFVAGGVSAVMSGKADRATFLKPFDEAIDARFQAAA
jgi:hypothetical protein